MVKAKHLLAAAVLIGAAASLSAQTIPSHTIPAPASISGLVGDVDDYLDVNGYSGVNFDKVFAFTGWADVFNTGNNVFNIGAAKKFGGIYTGLFFAGDFITSRSTTQKTDILTGTYWIENDQPGYALSGLFGLGNLGIKASILLNPNGSTSTTENVNPDANNDYKTTNVQNNYIFYPEVRAGYNLSLDNVDLAPYAYFGMYINNQNTKQTTKGKVAGTDTDNKITNTNLTNDIMFGVGNSTTLPKKDGSIITNTLSGEVNFEFDTTSRKTLNSTLATTTSSKDNIKPETYISLVPGWKGNLDSEKIGLELKSTLPIIFGFTNDDVKTTTDTDGTKTVTYEDTVVTKNSRIGFAPTLSASFNYAFNEKAGLHVGAEVTLPTFSFNFTTQDTYNNTNEDRDKQTTVKTNTARFTADANDFDLEWSTGFKFDLTSNFTFDISYNIIGDLFNNFSADPGWGNLLTSLDHIIFHELSFQFVVRF